MADQEHRRLGNKIVLIGAGDVGIAYAFALINQGVCDELAIIDIDEKKTAGNVMDLNHGVVWASSPTNVKVGTYDDCADAAMVVVCAGAAQKQVKPACSSSTRIDGIFLIASNPVDILTYATWKISGLPKERVIGSGTVLDSARFRSMLGDMYDVAPSSIHAYIIGEHGDSELPVLSSSTVGGVSMRKKLEKDPELHGRLEKVFEETRDAAYTIIDAKGSTSFGIGMGLARITRAVLQNQNVVLPVSAYLQGEYGEDDIYIGTPALVNRGGIHRVVELELDDHEAEQMKASVAQLREIKDRFYGPNADQEATK